MSAVLLPLGLNSMAQTLCETEEQIVFACNTKQGKNISVCIGGSGLSYRYGFPQKLELSLRDPGPSNPNSFRYYHYFRAGVDRTSLEIQAEGAMYEIFDDYDRPQRPAAGVRVTVKQSKLQATYLCAGKVKARWHLLEGKVGCSEQALNTCLEPERK